jgi:hypothetical protein
MVSNVIMEVDTLVMEEVYWQCDMPYNIQEMKHALNIDSITKWWSNSLI